MSKHKTTLTSQEHIFVQAIASGQSVANASKAAEVSRATGNRWMGRTEIKQAIDRLLGKVQETVQGQVQEPVEQVEQLAAEIIASKYREALSPACDVVVKIAKDPMESGATRLKAVQMIQDRLAPILKQSEQAQPPAQNEIIPRDLLQYATDEEIDQMNSFIDTLQTRKRKADQDRARLHA